MNFLFIFEDMRSLFFWLWMTACFVRPLFAQIPELEPYHIVWNSQSENSGESMPCGGGDVGLNVWVEEGELLFYLSRSGTFDENNLFPKLGRVRVRLSPNPFKEGDVFRQELKLQEGYVEITGKKGDHTAVIRVWVDVFSPVVHVEVESNRRVGAEAWYENWRTEDRELVAGEKQATSFKWAKEKVILRKDEVRFDDSGILFYHRNLDSTIFDRTVAQQGLEAVKQALWNPLKNLTFGGRMQGEEFRPAGISEGTYLNTGYKAWKLQSKSTSRRHHLEVFLHVDQAASLSAREKGLQRMVAEGRGTSRRPVALPGRGDQAFRKTREWWQQYWQRSYILMNPGQADTASAVWQAGRNYQLFRYMLGCNAYGKYPTKFNGGLFTYDPVLVDKKYPFTPDHRQWGGGTFTAQNQRLVYWPMLKSGDFDMMPAQFGFYLRILKNAEQRTRHYWGHEGACFTEQMENFGLPNYAEYGLDRPEDFDPGVEYNAWLEYHWDTVLEFCLMILDLERYTGQDISGYMPLIQSCVVFFDEHYRYLAGKRGRKTLDGNGNLVLYPGTSAETYKMAYNAVTLIAGLKTVLGRMLELPEKYGSGEDRANWKAMLDRIPPVPFREMQGHRTIAPAEAWERIQNVEIPQLYPVFPYGIYGIGKPDLEVALNTWKYDTEAIANRNHISWHQDNIFCARLGLTEEAAEITLKKLQDSGRRFPAFWGPGHDWVPDHNWGGSGMTGLQEMLMQTDGKKIYLFPAWPKDWDVSFKLHAPYHTTIEGVMKNGKIESLKVLPASRAGDVINMLNR